MVNSCSAYGCKNRNSKGSTITFHRFPLNNKALLKLWLYQIKRGSWEPSKYSVICSEHFTEDSFVFKGPQNSRRTLKNDAYPTIFSMAIYSEPPKRTFPGKKSTKEVPMDEDIKEKSMEDGNMQSEDEHIKPENTNEKNAEVYFKVENVKEEYSKEENAPESLVEVSVKPDGDAVEN